MSRILIAGIGNIFFGDDGFGVEVARRLERASLPAGVVARDFGIRGLHLAYALLDRPDLLVIADATARDGTPGTLYVLEPNLAGAAPSPANGHGMDLPAIASALTELGGRMPRVLLVGCEPACMEEGVQLSAKVASAIEPAIELIGELIARELPSSPSTEVRS